MKGQGHMARYVVSVTQDLIDHATRNNSAHCAVADAIKAQIPGATRVQVDIQTIRFSSDQDQVRRVYLTPERIQDYIIAYDAGDPLEPFAFSLYRPAWEGPLVRHGKTEAIVQATEKSGKGKTEKIVARMYARAPSTRTVRQFGRRVMRVNQLVQRTEESNDGK